MFCAASLDENPGQLHSVSSRFCFMFIFPSADFALCVLLEYIVNVTVTIS